MKKVVIKESELISLIKNIINEENKTNVLGHRIDRLKEYEKGCWRSIKPHGLVMIYKYSVWKIVESPNTIESVTYLGAINPETKEIIKNAAPAATRSNGSTRMTSSTRSKPSAKHRRQWPSSRSRSMPRMVTCEKFSTPRAWTTAHSASRTACQA